MTSENRELLFKDEAHAVVGAAMKLHAALGNGFLEAVYQEGLALAFRKFGVPFEAQKELRIELWGEKLNKTYFADFVCFGKIIVEIKALQKLSGAEESQVLNYLKATGFRLGILINFGAPSLEFKRIVR
ncbi:GxxExxY protein [Candidatus Spyradosoma sp. SGI.093]|uniref:GxxExxY protein n=1 Tax=Candidatus Spyradosoma sp. SGI.093 TaxID=3420583 RepID=UPI003D00E8C6